jgi:hypothetical protein
MCFVPGNLLFIAPVKLNCVSQLRLPNLELIIYGLYRKNIKDIRLR